MANFIRQRVDSARLPQQVVNKWSESNLAEGFVPFPKKLARTLSRIFPDTDAMKELSALLAVADFKRPNLTRDPSVAFLAFLAGLSEEEFRAALGRLENKGLVRTEGDSESLRVSLQGLLDAVDKQSSE